MEHTHFIDKDPNKYEALVELQKEHIQSMKEEQVYTTLDKFENAWYLKTNDFRNARELGYRQFVHSDNFDEYGNPTRVKLMSLPLRVSGISSEPI